VTSGSGRPGAAALPAAIPDGDLWYGNLLIRPGGTLSAMRDWERVALAGPAQDLALAHHLGPAFTGITVQAYARAKGPYSEKIRHRVNRRWQLRELTGLPLAAAAGDGKELAGCVARPKAGPFRSPASFRAGRPLPGW